VTRVDVLWVVLMSVYMYLYCFRSLLFYYLFVILVNLKMRIFFNLARISSKYASIICHSHRGSNPVEKIEHYCHQHVVLYPNKYNIIVGTYAKSVRISNVQNFFETSVVITRVCNRIIIIRVYNPYLLANLLSTLNHITRILSLSLSLSFYDYDIPNENILFALKHFVMFLQGHKRLVNTNYRLKYNILLSA